VSDEFVNRSFDRLFGYRPVFDDALDVLNGFGGKYCSPVSLQTRAGIRSIKKNFPSCSNE
jgi:hypothetical protein